MLSRGAEAAALARGPPGRVPTEAEGGRKDPRPDRESAEFVKSGKHSPGMLFQALMLFSEFVCSLWDLCSSEHVGLARSHKQPVSDEDVTQTGDGVSELTPLPGRMVPARDLTARLRKEERKWGLSWTEQMDFPFSPQVEFTSLPEATIHTGGE
ncbi:Guanine Nucleotide-Binding Protein G(I)/G(S)/G(T) Subunit Beta-3 [Manis pentadactyla]|nr:Guanine Nucleotide-Binding Protein G(I)/G(S)/G(T) Subunit Beta-3 [Manis pentadactyla]